MTPIRRQYLRIKKRYPQAIVFFRLGDFYETFDDDAKITAAELGITLTARELGKGQSVPMAGIPYHAVEGYLAKLINRGHKVAICEQLTDPATSKDIVQRDVVRVVTPGTVVEASLLQDKQNNYLAAALLEGNRAGIAYVDITTGEFAATQLGNGNAAQLLQQELARLSPAECLLAPDGSRAMPEEVARQIASICHVTCYDGWHFHLDTAEEALKAHFGVASLEGFGCAGLPLAVRAAGAVIQYLRETQESCLAQLTEMHTYSTGDFMVLDAATRRNLELMQSTRGGTLKGSLLWVLDHTRTPMGGRLLRRWLGQPLLDLQRLEARQKAVKKLVTNAAIRAQVRQLLGGLGDLERLINRVGQGIATPRDLVALRASLEVVPLIRQALMEGLAAEQEASEAQNPPLAAASLCVGELDHCAEVVSLIAQAILPDPPATLADGGVIAPGFSPDLDSLHASSQEARRWVAGLEPQERQRTGIRSLKVGYNKVFGYYIEVSTSNLKLVPPEYIRKQTLVGGERFITPELKEKESLILSAQEKMVELETAIFRQVCQQVAAASARIMATAQALAHIDVFASLAEIAVANNCVCPKLTTGDEIKIVAGRHPVVELSLTEEPFVPNDAYLSNHDTQIIILTGPNMAGKSTFLRQVALIVLMAQIGSFVPAESATIGLVDRIFTRVGAQDDIATGQSTFMVEMVETANILHHSTPKSLIILDEIGRGTSTYDGLSIAQAVVEHLHNHPRLGAKTLFASHYHELTALAQVLPRVRNFNVAVAEEGDTVVFLRKIVPGGADRSYGIHVAQLAGLPKSVIRRAEEVLTKLEELPRAVPSRPTARPPIEARQLALFGEPHPVVEELANLEVDSLTPLEAINKLYELQRKAREGGG